jgi:hypothetical protein
MEITLKDGLWIITDGKVKLAFTKTEFVRGLRRWKAIKRTESLAARLAPQAKPSGVSTSRGKGARWR